MNASTRAYIVSELCRIRQCELPLYVVKDDGTLERLPTPSDDRKDAVELLLAMMRKIPVDIEQKTGTCPVICAHLKPS